MKEKNKSILSLISEDRTTSLKGILSGLLPLAFFIFILALFANYVDIKELRERIASAGIYAPSLYILLKASTYVITPLSGGPLQVSSGALFGLWEGTFYSLIGDTLGGSINFWLARKFGRDIISKLVGSEGIHKIERLYQSLGDWKAVLFSRLFLSHIYDFISYAIGLTEISFAIFVVITVFGGFAPTLIFVALGSNLADNPERLITSYIILGVITLIPLFVYTIFSRRTKKNTKGE